MSRVDAAEVREAVTGSWRSRRLSMTDKYRIRRYLATGAPEFLHGTGYDDVRDAMMSRRLRRMRS